MSAPHEPQAFRMYVRSFLAEEATPMASVRDRPTYVPRELGAAFQRRLHDAGLAGITVPAEYGGAGLEPRHQEIFNDEAAGYWLPSVLFAVTIGMCVPTLVEFGTDEQKRRHIPRMLAGEEIWCQMFSEPQAGSDLASLRMRAERDGDRWVLNGQKVWTSAAHYADYAMCVARTDPDQRRQHGLSMFVVPMRTAGIEVRPLVLMTGEAAFNEVFCTDVVIPADHLVGELHDGWRCVTAMLMNERMALGASASPLVTGKAHESAALARSLGRSTDATVRDRIADLWIREAVLGYLAARIRASSTLRAGPAGSLAKLMSATLLRAVADTTALIAGPGAQAWERGDRPAGSLARSIVHSPSLSIGGGTSEIQRNIIGERLLGLPRDS